MGTATMGSPMTRQEALEWCADNVILWPRLNVQTRPIPPSGWFWGLTDGEIRLHSNMIEADAIAEVDVIAYLNMPGPASRNAVLEWCVDNVNEWPTYPTPTLKTPPGGWTWLFIGDGGRLERIDKRGEAIHEVHWRDAKNLKAHSNMGKVKELTRDEAIGWLQRNLDQWPGRMGQIPDGTPIPPGWNWQTVPAALAGTYDHSVWRDGQPVIRKHNVFAPSEPVSVQCMATICGVKVKVGDRVKVKTSQRDITATVAGLHADKIWFEDIQPDGKWLVTPIKYITGLAHLTDHDVAVEKLIQLIPHPGESTRQDIAKALIKAGVKLP